MDLDNIREILYAYTKEISGELYDDTEIESLVEDFIASNEELVGLHDAYPAEESY